jgi:hypothetical protein
LIAALATAVSACGSSAPKPPHTTTPSSAAHTTARPSAASTTMTINATVTPDRAGSPQHPQGVRIGLQVAFAGAGAQAAPVRQLEVAFPPGNLYQGASVPACSAATLLNSGLTGCPSGSVTGTGQIVANAAGAQVAAPVTVVNGGADKVLVYVELNNPVRIVAVVTASVEKLSGPSAYALRLTIPPALQSVAGVPVVLERMQLTAGRGDWLATVGCQGGAWRYTANATFADGHGTSRQFAVPCR